MKSLIFAFGTDDGLSFTNRHFGDSSRFDIYEISNQDVKYVKHIDNNSEEEEDVHADPTKAKSIAKILKKEQVQAVVSKQFGPNILRIKKKFVCIKSLSQTIEEIQNLIKDNFDLIDSVLLDGEDRGYIVEKSDLSFNYVKK